MRWWRSAKRHQSEPKLLCVFWSAPSPSFDEREERCLPLPCAIQLNKCPDPLPLRQVHVRHGDNTRGIPFSTYEMVEQVAKQLDTVLVSTVCRYVCIVAIGKTYSRLRHRRTQSSEASCTKDKRWRARTLSSCASTTSRREVCSPSWPCTRKALVTSRRLVAQSEDDDVSRTPHRFRVNA